MQNILSDEQRQHLEFIQGVITRMNSNSFQIKGFAITLIAALIAVYASNQNQILIYLGFPLTALFWVLDGYYLQQERKFRALFDDAVTRATTTNPVVVYSMSTKNYTGDKLEFLNIIKSKTIWPTYAFISLLLVALLFIKPITTSTGEVQANSQHADCPTK